MTSSKKINHLLVIILIACFNLTCFDMYNGVWDSGASDNYRLAVFQTTTAGFTVLLSAKHDGSLYQISSPVVSSVGSSSVMADFNDDGNIDFMSVSYDLQHRLFFTDGKGGIKSQYDFPNGTDNTLDSAVADFDGDGDPDIFAASEDTFSKNLFLNNGNSTFSIGAPWPNGTNGNFVSVSAADFDNDNDIDLYLVDSIGDIELYKNNGSGVFTYFWSYTDSNITDTAAADFDGDGDIDVIEVNIAGNIKILSNNGDGSFTQDWISPLTYTSQCVTIGDFDGDGDIDAYVGNQTLYNLILINDGRGNFTVNHHSETFNADTRDVVIGDIDLDGDVDIISGDAAALRIYRNNGSGSFTDMLEYAAWANTRSLCIGQIFK
jgi:hypothetical protein